MIEIQKWYSISCGISVYHIHTYIHLRIATFSLSKSRQVFTSLFLDDRSIFPTASFSMKLVVPCWGATCTAASIGPGWGCWNWVQISANRFSCTAPLLCFYIFLAYLALILHCCIVKQDLPKLYMALPSLALACTFVSILFGFRGWVPPIKKFQLLQVRVNFRWFCPLPWHYLSPILLIISISWAFSTGFLGLWIPFRLAGWQRTSWTPSSHPIACWRARGGEQWSNPGWWSLHKGYSYAI